MGNFCGKRDIPELTQKALKDTYGFSKADIMVLFGGSILHGGDVLANAMKHDIAEKYIIVGGAGHTTDALRKQIMQVLPTVSAKRECEAQLFAFYLQETYDLSADYLECQSTNCGNNISYLLDLLTSKKIPYKNIIFSQDATMQHRMEATMRNQVGNDICIINYATYQVNVNWCNNGLFFESEPLGMWDMNQYITLLMGEIPRLTDDLNGYGPLGKGFITHVDIPQEVKNAFLELEKIYGDSVRKANPLYESPR